MHEMPIGKDVEREDSRRLQAILDLCAGKPGYHSITVKAILSAGMDDEPTT